MRSLKLLNKVGYDNLTAGFDTSKLRQSSFMLTATSNQSSKTSATVFPLNGWLNNVSRISSTKFASRWGNPFGSLSVMFDA